MLLFLTADVNSSKSVGSDAAYVAKVVREHLNLHNLKMFILELHFLTENNPIA